MIFDRAFYIVQRWKNEPLEFFLGKDEHYEALSASSLLWICRLEQHPKARECVQKPCRLFSWKEILSLQTHSSTMIIKNKKIKWVQIIEPYTGGYTYEDYQVQQYRKKTQGLFFASYEEAESFVQHAPQWVYHEVEHRILSFPKRPPGRPRKGRQDPMGYWVEVLIQNRGRRWILAYPSCLGSEEDMIKIYTSSIIKEKNALESLSLCFYHL
jgi:hypothetical protein